MDLQPYVDSVRHELGIAARAGGDEAEALAERLTAPLESAIRLVLLDALSTAADEITRSIAPESVEVRLRRGEPEFVVERPQPPAQPVADPGLDESGGTWRVTLRLPEGLRSTVEAAAGRDGVSINAWMVRAAAQAAGRSNETSGRATTYNTGRGITGWVR